MSFPVSGALRLTFACALVLCVQQAAFANTYRVGVGTGCTHRTLQDAISAARSHAGEDTILINQQAVPAGRTYAITSQDLTIRGGYEFCGAADPVFEKTVIVGREGGGAVFTISGGGVVVMENLVIAGGDNPANTGGGIQFDGSNRPGSINELRLKELNLEGNTALFGAGLSFASTNGEPAFLTLGSGVSFLDNTAALHGGGIFLRGNARLEATSERLFLHRNHAATGGGIYVEQPAAADIGSARFDAHDTFFDNSAFNGGAIAVVAPIAGPPSRVRLFSIVPDRPMQFRHNAAFGPNAQTPGRGGALYLVGVGSAEGRTAQVCLGAVNFIENMGESAAIAHVDGARFGQCPDVPLPAIGLHACEPRSLCSRYQANSAGGRPDSSLIEVWNGGSLELRGVRMNDNAFTGSMVHSAGVSRAGILVSNSEIGGNRRIDDGIGGSAQSFLFEAASNTDVDIRHSTIAHNSTLDSDGVLAVIGRTQDTLPRPLTRVTASIVYQPDLRLYVAPLQAMYAAAQIDRVLLAQPDAWMAAATVDVDLGDPRFVGATDRRLRADSIAIDAMFDEGDQPHDLDGNPRVDLRSRADRGGIVDLGAFEFQDPDFLFGDGFE